MFPDRSYESLVSQYRKTLKLAPQRNHAWSDDEAVQLMYCVKFYGEKWEFIRRNYFPTCTAEQLRARHNYTTQKNECCLVIYAFTENQQLVSLEKVRYYASMLRAVLKRAKELEVMSENGQLIKTDLLENSAIQKLKSEGAIQRYEQALKELDKKLQMEATGEMK